MVLALFSTHLSALPSGFVYLDSLSPTIIQDLRYLTSNNFLGRPVKGYFINRCILTYQAARQLMILQKKLIKKGLSLKVYDCYRPISAVADFVKWSHNHNQKMKPYFYPRERKARLFKKGYIADYSGHSRGSTVDITLVSDKSLSRGRASYCYRADRIRDNSIDMGSNFDCLDSSSHYYNRAISDIAKKNRHYLRRIMREAGFVPYAKEWWHFTLKYEPYPRRYFNFPVR